MIDFTECKELVNTYGGSEKKKKIIYNNEVYLLKFPDPIREKNAQISYVNNQFSEYIGCHIFHELGLPVQKTILGTYKDSAKEKICVACRDFSNDGMELIEFSKLANSVTSSDKKFSTSIEDVYEVIQKSKHIRDKQTIIDRFWDMFLIDCLIGNPDRHLDNWGIIQLHDGHTEFSPVFDCGSCLFPLYSEKQLKDLLNNDSELKNVSYNVKSAYKMNGKTLFYHDINKIDTQDFKHALQRFGQKLHMENIFQILQNTPYLSDIYKEALYRSIEIRYASILKKEIDIVFIDQQN